MLAKRIIPCLDVTGGRVVKGVNFVDLRDAGDPVEIAARHQRFGLPDGEFPVMEDAGGEHRVGAAEADAVGQVFERADTARGDHRDRHGV